MGDSSQISSRFKYTELYCDSSTEAVSYSTGVDASNWPLFDFSSRGFNPVGIKILSCEFPVIYNTIIEPYNYFILNGALPIFIPVGNYTADELATQVQTALNAISPGFTVSFNSSTSKYTFSKVSDFTIQFYPLDPAGLKIGLAPFLGFAPNSLNQSSGGTLTSTGAAVPSGPTYLYLNSQTIGSEIAAVVQDRSTVQVAGTQLAKIPVTSNRGFLNTYVDPSPNNFFDFKFGTAFNRVDFYMTMQIGDELAVVDFKQRGFSVKIGLLEYREIGAPVGVRPSAGQFFG